MGLFEAVLGVAVLALAIWLVFGSSPQSRSPKVEQQGRFAARGDADSRRRTG